MFEGVGTSFVCWRVSSRYKCCHAVGTAAISGFDSVIHSSLFRFLVYEFQKQAECPPIQMEPVDLSVNSRSGGRLVLAETSPSRRRASSRSPESRKRRPSPINGIDLRVNKSAPGNLRASLCLSRLSSSRHLSTVSGAANFRDGERK